MSPHVSTLTLHRYRYGELEPVERRDVRAHVDGCPRCRRRLAVQERERQAFVNLQVPEELAAFAAPAGGPRPDRALGWLWALLPGLAMAAAVLVTVPAVRTATEAPLEITRLKGGAEPLEVWKATEAGSRPVRDDERLRAGDRIQVVFHPEGAPWITLAGRNPSGQIEVWRTLQPDGDVAQPAPFALTLDETPGFQEVFVIGTPWPPTRGEVAGAIAGADSARPLPNGVTVRGVMLPKE